jgi:dTDP-4-dehydrorhamnose 3,5-epimerase
MDDSTFFIIGANGQLGQALKAKYPHAKSADINELDITDFASVEGFDWSSVRVIFNAAAYTNVDGAEKFECKNESFYFIATGVAKLYNIE